MQGSTTPARRSARSVPKTWCPVTKEQGFVGREAPRPLGGRLVRPQRRGAPRRRNKGLLGGEHHVHPAVGSSGPQDVVPGDEETRVCGERSTTPARRSARPVPKTWCPATKEQGFAGREAPRPLGGWLVRSPRRGARRRRNKGLRGGKHHAGPAVGSFGPKGVVPGDEETRVCGERSTTPALAGGSTTRAEPPHPRRTPTRPQITKCR